MLQHWILGLSLLSLPFWWGEATDLQIVDSTPLADLLETSQTRNPILAPDGSALAWNDNDGICVYRFEADETTCTPWPEESRLNTDRYNLPTWSPDSRRIILHEDFLLRYYDSDIWAFDVESGAYTNLTDDGYEGGLINPGNEEAITVDFAPFYGPNGGELFFFRLGTGEEGFSIGEEQLTLMKMSVDGEVEPVRAMRPDVPGPTSIYRPGAFSEDGNMLYLLVMPADWNRNPATGIYGLDLTNDSFEQVVNLTDLQGAMPEWAREDFAPSSVETAVGGLVVWLDSRARAPSFVFRAPVFVDTTTSEVTSLIAYSGMDSAETMAAARAANDISILNFPYTGLVMPEGQSYWLMVTRPPEGRAIYEVPLPPSADSAPELLATLEQPMRPGMDVAPTLSEDGKLLMTDVLFTLEPEN